MLRIFEYEASFPILLALKRYGAILLPFDYLIIHSPKGIAEQLRLANFKSISFRPDFLNHFVFLPVSQGEIKYET